MPLGVMYEQIMNKQKIKCKSVQKCETKSTKMEEFEKREGEGASFHKE
jgi:hypothetical protein